MLAETIYKSRHWLTPKNAIYLSQESWQEVSNNRMADVSSVNASCFEFHLSLSAWNFHPPCQSITPHLRPECCPNRLQKLSRKSLTPQSSAGSWCWIKKVGNMLHQFCDPAASSYFQNALKICKCTTMQFPYQRGGSTDLSGLAISSSVFCSAVEILFELR